MAGVAHFSSSSWLKFMCDIWSSSSHHATIKERHTLFPEPYPAKVYCEFASSVIKTDFSLFKVLIRLFDYLQWVTFLTDMLSHRAMIIFPDNAQEKNETFFHDFSYTDPFEMFPPFLYEMCYPTIMKMTNHSLSYWVLPQILHELLIPNLYTSS